MPVKFGQLLPGDLAGSVAPPGNLAPTLSTQHPAPTSRRPPTIFAVRPQFSMPAPGPGVIVTLTAHGHSTICDHAPGTPLPQNRAPNSLQKLVGSTEGCLRSE